MIRHLSNDIYGFKKLNDGAVFLSFCQIRHRVSQKWILYKFSLIKSEFSGLYLTPNFLLKFLGRACLKQAYLLSTVCELE